MRSLRIDISPVSMPTIIAFALLVTITGRAFGDVSMASQTNPTSADASSGALAHQAGIEPPLLTNDDLQTTAQVELSQKEFEFVEASLNPVAAEPVPIDNLKTGREPDLLSGSQDAIAVTRELTDEEIQFNLEAVNPVPAATVHPSIYEAHIEPPL